MTKEDTVRQDEWFIIAITQEDELILDSSPNMQSNFSHSTYALDNGVEVPENMKKGVYLMYNLVIKKIKALWSLEGEVGFITITGDFKLLYDWGLNPDAKLEEIIK